MIINATRSVSRRDSSVVELSGADFERERGQAAQTAELGKEQLLIDAIRRFTAGETEAFTRIAEIVEPPLKRFFKGRVVRGLEVDDLIQEALIGVSKNAATFDPKKGGPFSWVMTIANRRLVDSLRAQARRHELFVDDFSEVEKTDSSASSGRSDGLPSDEIASQRELTNLRRRHVAEAIETLPGSQREAFNLAYYAGMTQQSIADGVGHPVGTVKAWIRRGLVRLRGENPQLEDLLSE